MGKRVRRHRDRDARTTEVNKLDIREEGENERGLEMSDEDSEEKMGVAEEIEREVETKKKKRIWRKRRN